MVEQEIIDLYDEYTHTGMDRRSFLNKLSLLAGGTIVAMALLPLLENNEILAATISEKDARIEAGYIKYPGFQSKVRAYMAQPKNGKTQIPGVVVIHENKGLHPHIEDITRRLALEGFLALAPDALSSMGGTPSDPDQAKQWIRHLDMIKIRNDFLQAVNFLEFHPNSSGVVGCIGFCWGGAMANQLAVHSMNLKAAVSFYGRQPKSADVPEIQSPILLHYAGLDQRINQGIPNFVEALDQAKIQYEMYRYEGVNHAFHNDTNVARYNATAAKLAWKRTVKFLKMNLS